MASSASSMGMANKASGKRASHPAAPLKTGLKILASQMASIMYMARAPVTRMDVHDAAAAGGVERIRRHVLARTLQPDTFGRRRMFPLIRA
jgi:hypothetical protein